MVTPALDALARRLRLVLVQTTHPGNIGAAARAMKTMGLKRLEMVGPVPFPHAEATALASGADDLLADAVVHADLDQAIADCHWVLGTSARLRSIPVPGLDVREAARAMVRRLVQSGEQVAVLFGQERSGLTNQQLGRCQHLVHIPTTAEFGSLNLAQSLQIVAYELRMAALELDQAMPELPAREAPPAPRDKLEGFYRHWSRVSLETGFADGKQGRSLDARWRRLFDRAEPSETELHMLRGFLSAMEKKLKTHR